MSIGSPYSTHCNVHRQENGSCPDCKKQKRNQPEILRKYKNKMSKKYYGKNKFKIKEWAKQYRGKTKEWRYKNWREWYKNKTKRWLKRRRRVSRLWGINYPDKINAHRKLRRAISMNKIERPYNCSICGRIDTKISGHHDDYSEPLRVIWCCGSCHRKIHNKKLDKTILAS